MTDNDNCVPRRVGEAKASVGILLSRQRKRGSTVFDAEMINGIGQRRQSAVIVEMELARRQMSHGNWI